MAYRSHRLLALGAAACLASVGFTGSAEAYLFWRKPDFRGPPVRGDEPGIGLPMPGATPEETAAHLLWNMRAGLNVAALQCQFAPELMTVRNYNSILTQHGSELNAAYKAISAYFKRTAGKSWQTQLDQYTTKTYNGFSTLHAQLGFCETAGSIGRDALSRPRGSLHLTATARMQEFRNSLVPKHDLVFTIYPPSAPGNLPPLDPKCWDRKDQLKKKCAALMPRPQARATSETKLPYVL
jgi:hypothetical protein